MKRSLLWVLALLLFAALPAQGAIYRWVDAKGTVHFTDSRKNIPSKYRSKATRIGVFDDRPGTPPAPPAPPPAGQAPPQRIAVEPPTPGGHNEQWWRERFTAMRAEFKLVQDGLFQKQGRLAELRRRQAIFNRPSDRGAVNAMESAVSADESRLNELLTRIDALNRDADAAGVPPEWRR